MAQSTEPPGATGVDDRAGGPAHRGAARPPARHRDRDR